MLLVARFRSPAPDATAVTICLEGARDELGERILDRITERVSTEEARLPAMALAAVEGRYGESLDACADAAEEVLRDLRLSITRRDVSPTGAHLSARAPNELAEIRIAGAEGQQTRVSFSAGAGGKDEADHRARRLQERFERILHRAR